MFMIIYDDICINFSLFKYVDIIIYNDSQKIIKNHKDWYNITNEEIQETKKIIKKIFNLENNTKLSTSVYKDALVMNNNDTYYCIKIINNNIEAFLIKGQIKVFIDKNESFFDNIEMIMYYGVNNL